MTLDELDAWLTSYGFVEISHSVYDVMYSITLGRVEYIFRDGNFNRFVIGNVMTQATISIPEKNLSEEAILVLTYDTDFQILNRHITGIKRARTIDEILKDLHDTAYQISA